MSNSFVKIALPRFHDFILSKFKDKLPFPIKDVNGSNAIDYELDRIEIVEFRISKSLASSDSKLANDLIHYTSRFVRVVLAMLIFSVSFQS